MFIAIPTFAAPAYWWGLHVSVSAAAPHVVTGEGLLSWSDLGLRLVRL